jgi:glycosyltransferase involved in cell wall biosynthesis/thioredoxin-like negative regulator of GroEL
MKKKKFRKKNRISTEHSVPTGVKLSLCMIVKNESSHLADCLGPIRSVMDEIIVVDTGSSDDTRDKARELGAKVFEFPWNGDFSAARNESIRRAAGQYILWLDADDRMEPDEIAKLQEMKAGLPLKRPRAYYLSVKSSSPGEGESTFYQLRLFPKRPGIRFENRVHEQVKLSLERLGIPIEHLAIQIRHTGYENPSVLKGKCERNWSILEEELRQDPHNPILVFNAARTLAGLNRISEAIEYLRKITENPLIQQKEKNFYLHVALMLGRYYLQIKDVLQAQKLFEGLAKEYPDNPLVHYGLGESYLGASEYAQAISSIRHSMTLPLEVTLYPINPEKIIYDQFNTLARCYQQMGMPEQAQTVLNSYSNRNSESYQTVELFGLLALENNQFAEAVDYLQEAVRKGAVSDQIFANLGLCYRKLGQWTKAEENLQKALKVNPERLEAILNLGHLFYQQEEYRKALEYFDRALALDPQLLDARLFRSDIFTKQGELDGVVQDCDELLRILGLERDLTIQSLQELGGLFFQIAGALDRERKPTLAIQALHVGFPLSPSRDTMERIVAKAKEIGTLPATLQRLEADLATIKGSSPSF